jgi:hypothetical protein
MPDPPCNWRWSAELIAQRCVHRPPATTVGWKTKVALDVRAVPR